MGNIPILPFSLFLTVLGDFSTFLGYHCFTVFFTVLGVSGFLMSFGDFRDFISKITKITEFTRNAENVTEKPDT